MSEQTNVGGVRAPRPTYGRALLDSLPRALFAAPVVCTQPEPWDLVGQRFHDGRTQRVFVGTMEHDIVRSRVSELGPASAVFGIGGGAALDFAKYAAWKREEPLVLMPTILSVDAAYTDAIGVREGKRVRYVGHVSPAHLLIDFDLLQRAPPVLNRAGVGDVLSIFTALWDWRQTYERSGVAYDAAVAAASRRVLEGLLSAADELREMNEAGLRALSEAYVGEVDLCARVGNARPAAGSEHHLAYCLEALTGKSFLHGQLVALCVLVVGRCQGQDVAPIAEFLRAIDLDCGYVALGTSRDEVREALLGVGAYVGEETQLLPGVFHFEGGVAPETADRVLDDLEALLHP